MVSWDRVPTGSIVTDPLLKMARSFFFLENGESSFRDIAEAIQSELGFEGTAQSWTVEEAVQEWGQEAAHFAFGSNSRIRAGKARSLLEWAPRHPSVIDWLKKTSNL